MSEITQPIHLFLGDDYMKGHRVSGEAGSYNVSDPNRAIMRAINGGTVSTVFTRPATIVTLEWSLEHVLQQIANPGTFEVNVTPANGKATFANASYVALQEGGALVDHVETFMDRIAVEPMFADLAPRLLFLVNGLGNFNAVTPRLVHHDVRPRGELERDGFSLHLVPTFASGAARNDLAIKLGATNAYSVRLTLSGGASRLEVSVNSNVNVSSTFAHTAVEELRVIVDWRRKRADVVRIATQQVAATMALTNGDWSGQEDIDATFGSFDGDISAPQSTPNYAAGRADLCCIQLAQNADLDDGEALIAGLGYMRTRPWGSGMPVWLILPPSTLLTADDKLTTRAAMFEAARKLENVFCIETEHLTRGIVGGRNVLIGSAIIELATQLSIDASVLFGDRRRTLARPRRIGYERFATDDAANVYIQELIDAGLTTRELSPALGGAGRRVGDGVDAPWNLSRTTRGPGDFHLDPNTNERLVPIDLAATVDGIKAPSSDGILVTPSDTGTEVTSATAPVLETARLINYRGTLDSTPVKTRAQAFDPILMRVEKTNSAPLLRGLNVISPTVWTAGVGGVVTTAQAAPDGGTDASLIADNSAVAVGIARGPALALSIGVPAWTAMLLKLDAAATTYMNFCVEEAGVVVVGVSVDPRSGALAPIGSPSSYYSARHGDWIFITFRYTPTVVNPNVAVQPAAGPVATLGTPDVASQGSVTVWGAPAAAVIAGSEELSNLSPYAFTGQRRVLRSGHVLCEGTRTNLMQQSTSLATSWAATSCTVARYDGRAPDASPNVWLLTDDSVSVSGRIELATSGALTATAFYTASVFIKKDAAAVAFPEFRVHDASRQSVIHVNPATGDFQVTSFGTPFAGQAGRVSLVVDDDGLEWWRAEVTFQANASTTHTLLIRPAATTVLGTQSVSATGSNVFANVQLEAGKFASSYIPTVGATLIRNADEHTFVAGDIDAAFYTTGFRLDYWPTHASGTDSQEGTMVLLDFVGVANVAIRLITSGASDSEAQYERAAGVHDSGAFSFEPGDKITIEVTFANLVFVYVNDVEVAGGNDISGDGDWTAFNGNTARLGLSSFGAIGELRAL